MKKLILLTAAVAALATVITWTALGANLGWTKTSRAVKTVDEVTGLEGVTYEKHFSPGLDFLGASLFGAGALAGASIFLRSKSKPSTKN
jgi:hypothetical protein